MSEAAAETVEVAKVDPKVRRPLARWGVAFVGGLVAVLTVLIPLFEAYLAEDIERCKMATEFFIRFEHHESYTSEDINALKSAYMTMITDYCTGGGHE